VLNRFAEWQVECAGRAATPILHAHHPVAFLGLFLMFLGFSQAYERHQSPLIIK
jgi:hypothetical protein